MPFGTTIPATMGTASGPLRHQLVETLREQIAHWERARRPQEAPVSSGSKALDRLLPGGGFHRGTLVEWLAAGDGSGVETLALLAAREACRDGGALVLLDRAGEFYPPAAIRLGIEPMGLIVVRVANEADHAWALDQALRCPAVSAVVAWPERLEAQTFRRLQLAAEQGGSLGLLVRPERVRNEPSWADVRLLVQPVTPSESGKPKAESGKPTLRPTRRFPLSAFRFLLKVQLLRSRGGASGGSVEVQTSDETRPVHLASQLARPAARRRAAGA
jgi:protein ImuA